MRYFSLHQLTAVFSAAIVLAGIFTLRQHVFKEEEERPFFMRSEYVYELKGRVKKPCFYTSSEKQTIESLINACGALRDGIKSSDLKIIPDSGTRLVFSDSVRIENMDAVSRINFFLPIRINRASVEDIALIPGVGKKTAVSIISYREKNNGIKDLNELISIRGIGQKKLEKIAPYLSL